MLTKENSSYKAIENHPNDSRVKLSEDGIVQTLSTRMGTGGGNVPMVMEENKDQVYCIGSGQVQETTEPLEGVSRSLNCMHDHTIIAETNNAIVRRLTPKECERLQGFPDEWTNIGEWEDSKGKKHKSADANRYKALGNSIALPFWEFLAGRICDQLRKDGTESPTMASLFDGIGGFPLVFSRCGCKPVWASEIEEFPIAVTQYHFKEVNE